MLSRHEVSNDPETYFRPRIVLFLIWFCFYFTLTIFFSFLQISMSVKKTANCVRSFVRTSLVDIDVDVPPDSEEMGKFVKVC